MTHQVLGKLLLMGRIDRHGRRSNTRNFGKPLIGILILIAGFLVVSLLLSSSPSASLQGTYRHNKVDATITVYGTDGEYTVCGIRIDGSLNISGKLKTDQLMPVLASDYHLENQMDH
jgi:hypothetical protein